MGGQLCKSARCRQTLKVRQIKNNRVGRIWGVEEEQIKMVKTQWKWRSKEFHCWERANSISVKTADINAAWPSPSLPPLNPHLSAKSGSSWNALWEEKRAGHTGDRGVRQRSLTPSQGLNLAVSHYWPRAHPCSHCYHWISSVQPNSRMGKRWWLPECCVSLMYEPALRIDMREMVNSRFYQEQKEPELSAGLFCFMDMSCLDCLGRKALEWNMNVCCLLRVCLFFCQPHFKLLNVMFKVKPQAE